MVPETLFQLRYVYNRCMYGWGNCGEETKITVLKRLEHVLGFIKLLLSGLILPVRGRLKVRLCNSLHLPERRV